MNLKSLDTNIILYAINVDCPEHKSCSELVRSSFYDRDIWIIADQVWFELYRLLRSNVVLKKPLTVKEVAETISWYRHKSGRLHCAWEIRFMNQLESIWKTNTFPASKSFDLILAITLKNQDVKTFHTRNTKEFAGLEYFDLINPIK